MYPAKKQHMYPAFVSAYLPYVLTNIVTSNVKGSLVQQCGNIANFFNFITFHFIGTGNFVSLCCIVIVHTITHPNPLTYLPDSLYFGDESMTKKGF